MLLELYMPGIMIVGVAFCGAEGGGAEVRGSSTGHERLKQNHTLTALTRRSSGGAKENQVSRLKTLSAPKAGSIPRRTRVHGRGMGGGVLSFLVNARPAVIFPSTKSRSSGSK
jgi:hypothetical protein